MQILLTKPKDYDIFGVNDVAFSVDGKYLAAALGYKEKEPNRWGGQVLIWDLASGKPPHVLHQCRNTIRLVAFSPDGKYLAAPSGDWTINIWKVGTWKPFASLQGHTRPIFSLAFSPNSKELLTGSSSMNHAGEAIFWDLKSHKARLTLPYAEEIGVWSGTYSPDGKTVALSADGVQILDAATGKQRQQFKSKAKAREFVFSRDGNWLAAASGSEVRSWDLATGKSFVLYKDEKSNTVNCLSWTPDGDNLAFGGNDGMVRILDPVARKEVKSYCWEVGNVNCLAFSQGMIAATGGADGLVLWDLL